MGVLVVCGSARGEGYNVDVGVSASAGAPKSTFGGPAGAFGFWNAVSDSASGVTLLTRSAVDQGVTATTAGGRRSLKYNNSLTAGDHAALLEDFQDTDDTAGAITWTIEGLTAGDYVVFTCVMAPDGAAFTTQVDVPQSADGALVAGGTFVGGYEEGVTHTRHRATVGGDGTLQVVVSTFEHFATLSGFQIVPAGEADGVIGASGDQFGRAAANVGDVNADGVDDFAVGAPLNDQAGVNAGKVVVYSGANGAELATLLGTSAGEQFGSSVAGAGDVNGDGRDDLVIGAPLRSTQGVMRGAAVVYSGMDFTVVHAKVGTSAGDRFGHAVAGGVDIDDDGRDDFIVGSPLNDAAGTSSGRVHVFSGFDGQVLKVLNGESSGDQFGFAVAGLRKADADGFADVAVGAPFHDTQGASSGRVYVIGGGDFEVLYTAEGVAGEQLGRSLASAGLVNADGRSDVVAGAPYADKAGGANAGRVVVYSGQNGSVVWTRTGEKQSDRFGWCVSGVGDVNGDGRDDIAASGPWANAAGNDSGRVHLRSGATGGVLAVVDGQAAGDRCGWAACGVSSLSDPGYNDVVLGAPFNDAVGESAGRVYLVTIDGGGSSAKSSMPLVMTMKVVKPPALVIAAEVAAAVKPQGSDVNSDGVVDALDMAAILATWGACELCPEDISGDGVVNAQDVWEW